MIFQDCVILLMKFLLSNMDLRTVASRTDQYSVMLIAVVEQRLPSGWRLEWTRQRNNVGGQVDLDDFLKFLETESTVREDSSRGKKIVNAKKEAKFEPTPSKSGPVTGSGLLARGDKKNEKKSSSPPRCTFCDGQHHPSSCEKPMSLQERWKKVQERKGCWRCAVPGHQARSPCFWKKLCGCNSSSHPHIKQLCPLTASTSEPFVGQVNPSQCDMSAQRGSGMVSSSTIAIQMRTFAVKIDGDRSQKPVRVLCDTGCTYTTVKREIAERCNAKKIGTRNLKIEFFSGSKEGTFDVVQLRIHGVSGFGTMLIEAIVCDDLGGHFIQVSSEAVSEARSQGCVPVADVVGVSHDCLGLIIGEDRYDDILVGSSFIMSSGRKATPTKFGWVIHGGYTPLKNCVSGNASYSSCTMKMMYSKLEDFWTFDHIGILPEELVERDIVQLTQSQLNYDPVEKFYTVSWPWKEGKKCELGSNKAAALSRLRSLLRRQTQEEFLRYDGEVTRLLNEGHIERVLSTEEPGTVFYLPHHAVVKESRATTKIRLVFDASAKSEGKLSLNQCLEPGENLLPLIFGILLRFRLKRFALVGDLAQAFLMMRLESERQRCLPFLLD